MKKIVYGMKIGMTQVISDSGDVVPVTVINIVDTMVLNVDVTSEKSDKAKVLLGIEKVKPNKLNKSVKGQFDKYKHGYYKFIKEYHLDASESLKSGEMITVDNFNEKEKVCVRGKVIGKGTAGTIKRHNFKRGPMTHGSKNHRLPGSIGGGTDPGRVLKGTRMAGHMGDEYRTLTGLEVVKVDESKGLLYIKGAVPGKQNLLEVYIK